MKNLAIAFILVTVSALAIPSAVSAQAPLPRPPDPSGSVPPPAPPPTASSGAPQAAPAFPPAELDRIVSPIALYPDPLLAQVLAAATFYADIPEAARWADEHHYLAGAQLTAAITEDRLPWDPSVQALLPFPSVLDMMASAMPWTQELGDAVLGQRGEVMDAVQRMRQKAQSFGYLRSNQQVSVSQGPYVEIQPVDPGFVVVPYYDPLIVFGPPPPRFFVAGAIGFGFGVRIGTWFGPWGWGSTHFAWGSHALIINNAPWGRAWANRGNYAHPYPGLARNAGPRVQDRHALTPRTQGERIAPRMGRMPRESHRR
jgi:Protein of unknown function (DUF3300)